MGLLLEIKLLSVQAGKCKLCMGLFEEAYMLSLQVGSALGSSDVANASLKA